jgi:hypothetical protein
MPFPLQQAAYTSAATRTRRLGSILILWLLGFLGLRNKIPERYVGSLTHLVTSDILTIEQEDRLWPDRRPTTQMWASELGCE